MPNAAYRRGRKDEYDHATHLKSQGYKLVARNAGSHRIADLIMAKKGELLFIQCKPDAKDAPAKRAELRELASWVGAVDISPTVASPGAGAGTGTVNVMVTSGGSGCAGTAGASDAGWLTVMGSDYEQGAYEIQAVTTDPLYDGAVLLQ